MSTLWFILGIKASYGLPLEIKTKLIKNIKISQFQKDRWRLLTNPKGSIDARTITENTEGSSGMIQVEIVPDKKQNIKTTFENEKILDSLFEVPDNESLSLSEENELIGSEVEGKQTRFIMNADFRNQTAYKINNPHQFSNIKNDLNLNFLGKLSDNSSWVLGSRFSYDAVFDLTQNYNDNVKSDQRYAADLRDAYLDLSWGNCDFRLGNQQIVWGQAVGLFFADIVNPKDLREYILPDLD